MPVTGRKISKGRFRRPMAHRMMAAGIAGLLAASAHMAACGEAFAQAREPIPWSLFDLFGSKQEEAPASEAAPQVQQPEQAEAPLPPKRPTVLASPAPQPTVAEPAAPPPEERASQEHAQTPFGTVYRSLGSNEFVSFEEPQSVQLKPKQAPQKPAPERNAPLRETTVPPVPVPEEPVQQAVVQEQSEPVQEALASPSDSSVSADARTKNVPLPPPAPANRTMEATAVPQPEAGQPQTIAAAPAALPPVSTLTDRQIIDRANRFFNMLETMQADFTQIGGDGKRMTGVLYLERPGRVRFAYSPPATMEIVSDGKNVAIRDSKLNTSDVYSINQTPLKFLLRDPINLGSDLKVIEIERDPTSIQITLEDGSTIGGKAQITLFFDQQLQNLSRWQIHDAQGFMTTVILSQVRRTRRGG